MSCIVFVSITPLDKGESVSSYVVRAVETIAQSGLEYIVTPMGTIIEGKDWDEVMKVVGEAFKAVRAHSKRVSFVIKGDDREGRVNGLQRKVKSLQQKASMQIHSTLDSTETQ